MAVPKEAVRRQITALIPVYMNMFMAGCSVGWLPNALYYLLLGEEVRATYSQCALVASFFDIGKTAFAIPSGIMVDKYGRRKITMSVAFLQLFVWLGFLLNTSITMIYIGRFINGLAVALLDATSLLLVGEIASPEIRGRLTGIHNIFSVLGMISPSIINIIFRSYKSLSLGLTIISIISLLPMYWMAETPSYLVSILKIEKAKIALGKIRPGYDENQLQEEFEKLNSYIREEKSNKSELNWVQFLKLKSIRKPLMIGIVLNFFMSLTGGGTLTGTYVTVVFPPNQYISTIYYPLLGQIFSFLLVICTTLYIDKFPRRIIFLSGAVTMTAANAICAFVEYFIENQNMPVFQWIFLPGNVFVSACFWTTLVPTTAALKSEIYPQTVKGFGTSLAVLSQGLAAVIMYQLYMFLKVNSFLYLMYGIFSISAFILFIEVYFFVPESRGVELADLQMKFREKSTPSRQEDNVENNLLE